MTTPAEVRLGDLDGVAITRGFPTQRAAPDGPVPVMSVAAIRNQALPKHFADHESLADLRLDLGQPGDVLVAIEGGTVGETLVVPEGIDTFVPSQQAATLRVADSSTLDPWYLGAVLTTELGQEKLRRLTRGAGIQRISIKDLASLTVPIPPLDEQHEIGQRFQAFETAIRSHRAITSCLEELRALDLVVMFAGHSAGDQKSGRGRQPRMANDDLLIETEGRLR